MVWSQLDLDKPHWAYLILGAFTSLFMLCSLFIKEKLYIGEATVATICGVIFGPHGAGLFNPLDWGNTDKITLELSRIVLVVQCFAIGVELPKSYMERHWKSVAMLLLPIMTLGWLITSLIIWVCVTPLNWLESLAIAACVTATDPVLASSVVGKGKFAKRIPKHLRDILSAESGCNDGMAFPFIYLAYYLYHYNLDGGPTVEHWIANIILYELLFGTIYGVLVGYIARHAIKWSEEKKIIDRESFLVFYFVLALFCAGSASTLGLDDLLVGFAAGVGFSNDGWFTQRTEESHVSNVIDLLLNLAYFVYLGSVIPWDSYNMPDIGLVPWRLVVISILVILFRRIPAMLAFKPLIPDIKNWREALFAGHFGPIGVGAIYAVILLRAEVESDSSEPQATLPGPDSPNYLLIQTMWPIVTFIVVSSILVHGSSIAAFTLGKRINTLTLTMSYTNAEESNWMDRLPRIASKSRSTSKGRSDDESAASDGKNDFPPGTLGPIGVPKTFLRRQMEEENAGKPGSRPTSRSGSLRPSRRKKRYGGPVSESAITPTWHRNQEQGESKQKRLEEDGDESQSPDRVEAGAKEEDRQEESSKTNSPEADSPEIEAYEEGGQLIVEDEEGNVLSDRNVEGESPTEKRAHLVEDKYNLEHERSGEHAKNKRHPHERNEGEEFERSVATLQHPSHAWRDFRNHFGHHGGGGVGADATEKAHKEKPKKDPHRGPAHAYQYGNKIIVEDEDGEVVKTYEIPPSERHKQPQAKGQTQGLVRRGLGHAGAWKGKGKQEAEGAVPEAVPEEREADATRITSVQNKGRGDKSKDADDDVRLRFAAGGRRMSTQDFIQRIQSLDPKARITAVDDSDASDTVKKAVKAHAKAVAQLQTHADDVDLSRRRTRPEERPRAGRASSNAKGLDLGNGDSSAGGRVSPGEKDKSMAVLQHRTAEEGSDSDEGLHLVDSNSNRIPMYDLSGSVAQMGRGKPETAAARRRRQLEEARRANEEAAPDSDDDGTERVPPHHAHHAHPHTHSQPSAHDRLQHASSASGADDPETAAERKRRLAALSQDTNDDDVDSEEDGRDRMAAQGHEPVAEPPRPGHDRYASSSSSRGRTAPPSAAGPGIKFAELPQTTKERGEEGGAGEGGQGSVSRGIRWASHIGKKSHR